MSVEKISWDVNGCNVNAMVFQVSWDPVLQTSLPKETLSVLWNHHRATWACTVCLPMVTTFSSLLICWSPVRRNIWYALQNAIDWATRATSTAPFSEDSNLESWFMISSDDQAYQINSNHHKLLTWFLLVGDFHLFHCVCGWDVYLYIPVCMPLHNCQVLWNQ